MSTFQRLNNPARTARPIADGTVCHLLGFGPDFRGPLTNNGPREVAVGNFMKVCTGPADAVPVDEVTIVPVKNGENGVTVTKRTATVQERRHPWHVEVSGHYVGDYDTKAKALAAASVAVAVLAWHAAGEVASVSPVAAPNAAPAVILSGDGSPLFRGQVCDECGRALSFDEMGYGHDCDPNADEVAEVAPAVPVSECDAWLAVQRAVIAGDGPLPFQEVRDAFAARYLHLVATLADGLTVDPWCDPSAVRVALWEALHDYLEANEAPVAAAVHFMTGDLDDEFYEALVDEVAAHAVRLADAATAAARAAASVPPVEAVPAVDLAPVASPAPVAVAVATAPMPEALAAYLGRLLHAPKKAHAEAWAAHLLHGGPVPAPVAAEWSADVERKVRRHARAA